jgi:F0F1-type ATP synthase epsilon subunit
VLVYTFDAEKAETEYLAAKEALEKAETRKEKIEANLNFKRARARFQVNK